MASPPPHIKRSCGRRGLPPVWIAVALLLRAPAVAAQAPDEDWRTLDTEHFRVTFPAGLESLGRRAASIAETAHAELSGSFLEPRSGRIDLLLTDHVDGSNGYALLVPSDRIVVYARPPVDGPDLGYFDDWMELVITHELAHIVHLDHTANPIGRLLRSVVGRADDGWPFFPNVATPGWVIEGLATWYESRLTGAGRVDGTFHDMVLRTAMLEGRFEGIAQAGGESPLWPGGVRSYAYGSLFFAYLLERYGAEGMTRFADAVAGQWVPYRLNAAGRSAFGVSLSDAWREWTEGVAAETRAAVARLSAQGPVSEPERHTTGARWALHPSVSPDGRTLAYTRADGRSDLQLERRAVSAGGSVEPARDMVGRTNGLATYSWMPDGRMLVAQLEQRGPYRAYADLYVMDLEGGSQRLTRGARVDQPSVAGDAGWAVAVQHAGGTNALVRVDLASGQFETLVAADPDVHWAFPRVSPDGRWIAATRWEPGAWHDVVILEAATGREVHRVTRDRALDLAPSWSPDSRWLVWASDRTGIMNILGAEVEPISGRAGEPRLLTNVRTGAVFPSVDPAGEWIWFSGYHVDGWEAERVRFEPSAARAAPPAVARFDPGPTPPSRPESAQGEVEGYSTWPTLLPTYWQPRLQEPIAAPAVVTGGLPIPRKELTGWGVGAETSGFDLVGRHVYAVYAQAFGSSGPVEGGLGYAYQGLGNPVFGLSAEQRWAFGGTLLGGSAPDTLYVLARERTIGASVTLRVPRYRRDVALSLGGGWVWEKDELLDSNLGRSTLYQLTDSTSRMGELWAGAALSTARSHSFQLGGARGYTVGVQARSRRHFGLDAADVGVVGTDRTFAELTGRVRAYVPLWGGGYATHVLALQLAGGAAFGPGAKLGHFGVGGATGTPEDVTGLDLFGGSYIFLPVRGYDRLSRYGRFAWASAAEYRFPLWLVHRGLGAWPLYFDRVLGSLFVDVGDAWDPSPRLGAVASAGAEITVSLLGFWNAGLLLRSGVAVPLSGGSAVVYTRAGLPF